MRGRASGVVALVVLALLAGASCDGGSGKASTTTTSGASSTSSSSTSSTSSSTVAPTTSAKPPPTVPCGSSSGGTSLSRPPSTTMLLTAVTVRATARCSDEVVFTFRSSAPNAPGVRISMVHPPFVRGGSGAPVTVPGQTFYQVRFEPASTFDIDSGQPTYAGPTSIAGTGSQVRAVVNTEAFEGVVTWIVGVRAGDGFRFAFATNPPSLVMRFGP